MYYHDHTFPILKILHWCFTLFTPVANILLTFGFHEWLEFHVLLNLMQGFSLTSLLLAGQINVLKVCHWSLPLGPVVWFLTFFCNNSGTFFHVNLPVESGPSFIRFRWQLQNYSTNFNSTICLANQTTLYKFNCLISPNEIKTLVIKMKPEFAYGNFGCCSNE